MPSDKASLVNIATQMKDILPTETVINISGFFIPKLELF